MGVVPASATRSFGKYDLVAKLATGGMAEIFLARLHGDGGFEKLVCIKRILPHLARDPQFIAMFLDEARVAARISHPNVCQVFELGECDGMYYIAMEYLEGVPLSCFRRGDYYPLPPDPKLVAGFGVQACEGLHHAHQLKRPDGELLGVVHRDISPQNLFVTTDGIVKVLDFGIAKVTDASIKTSTGAMKGTYAYMSPEQLRGEPLDRRTDVFAMGIVLWETLAQRHLFKRENEFLTFQAITNDPIPDICEVRPDVPPLLGDTVARALSRKRDDRFASCRALGEALAQAVAPLGGAFPSSAISDEIGHMFQATLAEQRMLLRIAREGGQFDLEEESPLVGHGTQLATTPVSNLQNKIAEARADAENYLAAQRAIDSIDDLDDADHSSSGFTPPPGTMRPARPRSAMHAEQSRRYPIAPAEWQSGFDGTDAGAPAPRARTVAPAPRAPSKLPWIIALVAVGAAGAAGALLYTSRMQPAAVSGPAPEPSSVPAPTPVVAMHEEPAPAPTVPAPDAAIVEIEKPIVATVPATHPDTHPPRPTKVAAAPPRPPPPPPPPAPSGPPGFITIDSAPVYAVIFIDGKRYGETPLVRLSLPAGKHSVRAVSPSGASQSISIAIESGKTAPVRRIEW